MLEENLIPLIDVDFQLFNGRVEELTPQVKFFQFF